MQRDVRAILDGALGGALGTVTMSAVMLLAGKAGLMGEHPPDLIAGKLLDATGVDARSEAAQDALASVAHLGFGVGSGAVFAVLHRRLRLPIPAELHGVVFGTLVWAVSYRGWVPALGIMPPAEEDQPGRPAAMVLAHWVYGATLGAYVGRE